MTTLTQEQMLDVMALSDGELDAEKAASVQALVDSDAEAHELFVSLRALGDGVRVTFHPDIEIAAAVLRKITPNDLDKARIRRTARTRMAVVGAALVALAAGVMFYVREARVTTSQKENVPPPVDSALASASATGVEVDFVDTPSPVSLFYVPAESTTMGAEGKTTETPPSVVVWVDDNAPPPAETP